MPSVIPRQSAWWDERRNTSAVFGIAPEALGEALDALAAFQHAQPELYAWVAEGAPRLSEDGHVERFGVAYGGVRARRAEPQRQAAQGDSPEQLDLGSGLSKPR